MIEIVTGVKRGRAGGLRMTHQQVLELESALRLPEVWCGSFLRVDRERDYERERELRLIREAKRNG